MEEKEYNYSKFLVDYYDMEKFNGPLAGNEAPDFDTTLIDGTKTKLSDWFDKPIVLELGSTTCPLFCQYLDRMNQLQEKFTEFHFLVLYVREAHPGKKIPKHLSVQDKISSAKKLFDFENEKRTLLIDDIKGTAHKLYGSMPNSCFVIHTDGKVIFTSDTTNHPLLEKVLEQYDGKTLEKRFNFDRFMEDRGSAKDAIKVMNRGGFKAITDFLFQLPKVIAMHKKLEQRFKNQQN